MEKDLWAGAHSPTPDALRAVAGFLSSGLPLVVPAAQPTNATHHAAGPSPLALLRPIGEGDPLPGSCLERSDVGWVAPKVPVEGRAAFGRLGISSGEQDPSSARRGDSELCSKTQSNTDSDADLLQSEAGSNSPEASLEFVSGAGEESGKEWRAVEGWGSDEADLWDSG